MSRDRALGALRYNYNSEFCGNTLEIHLHLDWAVLSPVCVVLEKQSERETPLRAHQRASLHCGEWVRAVLSAVAYSFMSLVPHDD